MPPQRVFSHHISSRTLILVLADFAILAGSVLAGNWIGVIQEASSWVGTVAAMPRVVGFLLLGMLTFHVAGLYDYSPQLGRKEVAVRGMSASAVWGVLYAAVAFSVPGLRLNRFAVLFGLLIGTVGTMSVRWLLSLRPALTKFRERLLFLGATPLAEQLTAELGATNTGYEVLGYVDDDPANAACLNNGFRILGTSRQLQEIVAATKAGMIVVALAERRGVFPMQEILECKLRGVRIEDWPTFYEKLTGKIIVQNLRPSWLVFSEGFNRTRVTRLVKRVVDLALSTLFLALGWPILLLAAIAIKLDSPGSVFVRQERVGERGRIFRLLKFRTMVDDAEAQTGPVWTSEKDPRITRVGRLLRKTRLDEFPQILNVIKGEMSFIGPRPERPHFVAQLQEKIPYYTQRHVIKPGITGWAQVRYSYGATIEDAEQKLQYDLYYVKNMSIFLDMLILLSSIQVVLFGKGAR